MAILVDYNYAMVTSVIHSYNKVSVVDDEYLKLSFFNRLRQINRKWKNYGSLVLCCEGQGNWRKDFFPNYKALRKQRKDSSYLDWDLLFKNMNQVRDDVIQHFNYPVIQVDKAEADDVIASIARVYNRDENILIFSADADFYQLQKYPNIHQYSPLNYKLIKIDDPNQKLKEKIIRGDAGDGIPNLITDDDVFILGRKQKQISKEKFELWMNLPKETICYSEELKRNWIRNETLIDFNHIPSEICTEILDKYNDAINRPQKRKDGLMDYFIDNNLGQLVAHLQDF